MKLNLLLLVEIVAGLSRQGYFNQLYQVMELDTDRLMKTFVDNPAKFSAIMTIRREMEELRKEVDAEAGEPEDMNSEMIRYY